MEDPEAILVDLYASRLPFQYSNSDIEDLGRTRELHYADAERRIETWSRSLVQRLPERGRLAAEICSALR